MTFVCVLRGVVAGFVGISRERVFGLGWRMWVFRLKVKSIVACLKARWKECGAGDVSWVLGIEGALDIQVR